MPDCLIVFAAMSQVRRVKKVLEAGGAYYEILRSPHCISPGGCSYSIRCAETEIPRVLAVTGELSIPVSGVYGERRVENQARYEPYAEALEQ